MENNNLVEEINAHNLKLYGPIQECCDQYKHFCRCSDEQKILSLAVKEKSKLKTK